MITARKNIIRRRSLLIVIVGWSISVWIYFTARKTAESRLVEEYTNSKRYLHDLEAYGGKANILADQFWRWAAGFWHGRCLAFTVATLTLVAAAGYLFLAWPLGNEGEES